MNERACFSKSRITVPLFLLAINLTFLSVSSGQSINYLKYSIPEGLPSQEVYEIFQDKKGFIWIATDNGISKFDGEKLKTYHLKDGLSDPVVFSFHEDPQNKIWLRTYSGKICYIEDGYIKRFKENNLLSNIIKDDILYSIAEDSGSLWFATGKLMGQIKNQKLVIKEKVEKGMLVCKTINDHVLIGGHGVSFLIKKVKINDKTYPIYLSDTLRHNKVYCATNWMGNLYFSINTDIFEYSPAGLKKVFTGKSLIISLSKDQKNNLWVGYHPGGVERFSSNQFNDPWSLPFLKERSVSKVIQDNEEGFWISTLEEGIFYIPNLNIIQYKYPENSQIRIAVSNKSNVFMSDLKGNLYIYDAVKNRITDTKIFKDRVMSLYVDNKEQLWVSTSLISLMDSSKNIKKTIRSQSATSFAQDHEFIWAIGSTRLTKFNLLGEVVMLRVDSSILRTIHIDDSLIYLGIRSGIEIKDKNFNNISTPKELADIKISVFLPLNDSILFVATIGSGFFLLNKKDFSVRHYHAENKFIADNIYTVLKIDGQLWIGTENGIAIISTESLLNGNLFYEFLSRHNGLPNNKINQLADTPNSVWVFTDDGYSVIPKTKIKFASRNPVFYLKEIQVNNQLYSNEKLSHNENDFQIDFGFISFNNQNLFLRYRIKKGELWAYTKDRTLKFNSLAPGDYSLEIQYSTDNTYWKEAYQSPLLSISPPWWRTWYFQIASTCMVLLIAFYFTRQLKQRNKLLNIINEHQKKIIDSEIEAIDRDRNRIAKDLHDGIGTTLTSIKMGINQVLTKYDQPEAENIENRLQDILKEVKNIIYDLTPPTLMQFGLHEGLKNYIEKIATDTHILIKLNIFGEEIKQPKINLFIFRITQELVVNSLKHSNAKNITIHLSTFDDLLNILYEDDGNGFMSDEVSRGHGLYNIESRIQSLNGKILFETSPKGVSYSIDIPLLKENSEPNKDTLL